MDLLYDKEAFEDTPTDACAPPSEEELTLFRQQVAEWLKLDDQVRKLSVAVRERRVHQRALASKIQDFMVRHNYDNLHTQQGRIRATVRTVKQPIKLQEIRTTLVNLADVPVTGQELIRRIFEADRPVVQKQSLRRIMPKVSLRLDL